MKLHYCIILSVVFNFKGCRRLDCSQVYSAPHKLSPQKTLKKFILVIGFPQEDVKERWNE